MDYLLHVNCKKYTIVLPIYVENLIQQLLLIIYNLALVFDAVQ